ncbi:endonuclease V [Chryseobacterium indologenes]|uniref:Endonuclease V n=1 Tax=Chryseobacterium indologenes TaxID=253 RepID=A0A1Z3VZJ9_CHRID|nr:MULTISPECIES: endonuclease V [Chryseobacterium]ASE60949.1 endonuclease V [Chryseobacterium indologenes]ATN05058.1 endonuclease V [Chryseobacterium indologenes]AYY86189.1 endonuclease V [Chryseobacterium indologenes]AYZ35961.1 endonuclease V [Chryseobacterium indologenes]AZB16639.1 endonuclease V [Chryseobacterium indologenes]
MIYAFDTYYYEDYANTVCIAFADWSSEKEVEIFTEQTSVPSGYESGAFYKRELPCIVSLLDKIVLRPGDIIIVDGYVTLDNEGKIGLGGYLYEVLKEQFPVVGIAKNEFTTPDSQRRSVVRGESKTPLFLTAKGIDVDEVKLKVEQMHGTFRIPALLKKLDQLTRE